MNFKHIFVFSLIVMVSLCIITGIHAEEEKAAAAKAKVIYNFSADQEMQQFISMIQNKQAILTKISVLQEYLIVEKAKLDQINGQLLLKFQVDPSKNYNLDPKQKVIVEVPPAQGK